MNVEAFIIHATAWLKIGGPRAATLEAIAKTCHQLLALEITPAEREALQAMVAAIEKQQQPTRS
jgi:hypothetical protein